MEHRVCIARRRLHAQRKKTRRLVKKKEQPRNETGHITSTTKPTEKEAELNPSIISVENFECYNKRDGKLVLVHINIEDKFQLLPCDDKLTPEQGITNGNNEPTDPLQPVRKFQRLPSAKTNRKLGGVRYYTGNNEKILNIDDVLQEKRRNFPIMVMYYRKRGRTCNIEDELRTVGSKDRESRKIRSHTKNSNTSSGPLRKWMWHADA